jgi:type IV pilus assembly protein PilV
MQLKPASSRGLALIEVLVSLLLIGLAAAAWLQAQADAVRQTRLSAHQALALVLATDMAERLRASPAVAPAMGFSAPFAAQASLSALGCDAAGCDAQAWAAADASQWRELVRDALPQGSSRVQVDASSRQARITLAWRDPGALDSALGRGSAQPCPAELALDAKEGVLCYTLEVAW